MKKSGTKSVGRKRSPWKILLIVALVCAGVLALALATLAAVYYYEASRPVCWKSGEVVIDGKSITLPCLSEQFEALLSTEIPDGKDSEVIRTVTVDGQNGKIEFKVYLSNDSTEVKGIMACAKNIGDTNGIVFPGGVTLNSGIETVNELYATEPLNIYHSRWSEEIVFSDAISSGYRYVDRNSFQINIDTINGEVDEIFYCYIADE